MVRIFIGPVLVERQYTTKGIAQKASLTQRVEMKVTLVTFKTKPEMLFRIRCMEKAGSELWVCERFV